MPDLTDEGKMPQLLLKLSQHIMKLFVDRDIKNYSAAAPQKAVHLYSMHVYCTASCVALGVL